MSVFKGHKSGFNPKGSNACVPNEMGPPTTKFGGRPAVPAGPLKRYPGAAADISNGNRRLAKASHGEGEGSGVTFSGAPSGFKNTGGVSSGRKPGGMDGKRSKAMSYNKK
jgi:hypothetical protein